MRALPGPVKERDSKAQVLKGRVINRSMCEVTRGDVLQFEIKMTSLLDVGDEVVCFKCQ